MMGNSFSNVIPSDSAAHSDEEEEPVLSISHTLNQDEVQAPIVSDPSPECIEPEQGDASSLGPGHHDIPSSSALCSDENEEIIELESSVIECCYELKNAVEDVHSVLSRHQGHKDLERLAIEQFERALGVCPLDHPCRGFTKSNMTLAKVILYKVNNAGVPLNDLLSLYQRALSARPVGHVDRPSTLIHLAILYLARFGKHQRVADKVQAKTLLHQVVELCSSDCTEKWAAYSMLRLDAERRIPAVQPRVEPSLRHDSPLDSTNRDPLAHCAQLWEDYGRLRNLVDLENAISLLEGLVMSVSLQDEMYPSVLHLFGSCLSARFQRLGYHADLEKAVSSLKRVVELTPDGHPEKSGMLNGLGNSFAIRFQHSGEPSDLEQSVSRRMEAIRLTPDSHRSKPGMLYNLGASLITRFYRFGDLDDLQRGLSIQKDGIELTPDHHPEKPAMLSSLGFSFRARFEQLGELHDLEEAILNQKNAVKMISRSHPDSPSILNHLGVSFRTRFENRGDLGDLDQAILNQKDAVALTSDGRIEKPSRLADLGHSLLTRFTCLGELRDLEEAISSQKMAVHQTPDQHPDKPKWLSGLGNSLVCRFQRFGNLRDLQQAISSHGNAVKLTPSNHPDKPRWLYNLGNSFLNRYHHLRDLGDLKQAISNFEDAVKLAPDRHVDRPTMIDKLANSFSRRFERLGDLRDLERAISSQNDVVRLTPDNRPDKPERLDNLGSSLVVRFHRLGDLKDLEQATSSFENAVKLTPDHHPGKPGRLNNLGTSFAVRFERLGELADLEQAILRKKEAVELTPDYHPDKPGRLSDLGNFLHSRFKRLGKLGDLEKAISNQRGAVELTPDGHPTILDSLGGSLFARFERLKEVEDLEGAISSQKRAIKLTPDGHIDKPAFLNNLGISLRARFEHLGESDDLEQAISHQTNAVGLTPDGHSSKSTLLNCLGCSILVRYLQVKELHDLERAILRFNDAVGLTLDGHPGKPDQLNNLANSFRMRFSHLAEFDDLERAILIQKHAVKLTPDDHPNRLVMMLNLGHSFRLRFDRLEDHGDLEQAISFYSCSASHSPGYPTHRFTASLLWISCARISKHKSLLQAYSVAIGLLPQLAWIGLSLHHRFDELLRAGADIVQDATAEALASGHLEVAIEWLEQGRSIVWADLLQLRSSHDELLAIYPDHALKLQRLSAELEEAGIAREKIFMTRKDKHEVSLEHVADRHRNLAIERDNILQGIRRLPGFERFLLHKEFSQLRASARNGPVVILNAAESRCDALIVLADVENVIHVPLSNFTFEHSKVLQTSVKNICLARVGHPGRLPSEIAGQWESVLSTLWKCVVKPVLDSLAFVAPGSQSRIFWCPTGPFAFLPIHAAGFYDTQYLNTGHKIFDFVISSYIPTLSILSPSSDSSSRSSDDLRFLAVRQPKSDGLSQLPGVDAELKRIKETIGNYASSRISFVESCKGTVEEVLELMREAEWVHFACHGIQDAMNPTESGLCLADETRLKLTNIIAISRPESPKRGLAFLSACQTATGDKELPDEAIHIAAGMLFAGFGGVIGTMWSISDQLAPKVAGDVYEQLFSKGTRPDYREAAQALHVAVGQLRENRASFSEWIPFIHVGH